MSEQDSKNEFKKKLEEASFMTKITVTFTACARLIIDSKNVSPETKGDAMRLAVNFFRSNVEIDMIERILKVRDATDAPLEDLFPWIAVQMIEEAGKDETKLKTIMELFTE